MTDLIRATAAELSRRLTAREVSSVELTQAHLDRIADVDGEIHAFLHVDADGALATARDIDARRAAGEELPALAGVPIAVKDVIATKGVPTTAGSRILEGWVPPYDATVTTRLKAAGLPILGKTNMDEFAMGSSTEHSGYGPTRNPWDTGRIPGGSGGGSAAAVAAFEAPLAVGTDTGGSIRQPGAMTGTVGVKPTYGGVSRYGLIALASSLDQAGPVTRSVLDAALLHEVIAGHDPCDSTSIDRPVPPVVEAARRADVAGPAHRRRTRARRGGLPARRQRAVRRVPRPARGRRRRDRRGLVPELRARPGRVLPDPARARRAATSPASTPCATACGSPPTASTTRAPSRSWRPAATPASATRSSAASSWAPTPCPAATTTPTTARPRRSAP